MSSTRLWSYCLSPLLMAQAASAQRFSFGLKAGVPITNFVHAFQDHAPVDYKPAINRYVVGGTAEVHLPFGITLEIDALYRHFGYSGGYRFTSEKTTTGAWEFPLLLKRHIQRTRLRPFINGGLSIDTLSGTTQAFFLALLDNRSFEGMQTPIELKRATIVGLVAGGGIELQPNRLHFSPELRYTRWTDGHFSEPFPDPRLIALKSNRNQVEFLLGVTF